MNMNNKQPVTKLVSYTPKKKFSLNRKKFITTLEPIFPNTFIS